MTLVDDTIETATDAAGEASCRLGVPKPVRVDRSMLTNASTPPSDVPPLRRLHTARRTPRSKSPERAQSGNSSPATSEATSAFPATPYGSSRNSLILPSDDIHAQEELPSGGLTKSLSALPETDFSNPHLSNRSFFTLDGAVLGALHSGEDRLTPTPPASAKQPLSPLHIPPRGFSLSRARSQTTRYDVSQATDFGSPFPSTISPQKEPPSAVSICSSTESISSWRYAFHDLPHTPTSTSFACSDGSPLTRSMTASSTMYSSSLRSASTGTSSRNAVKMEYKAYANLLSGIYVADVVQYPCRR